MDNTILFAVQLIMSTNKYISSLNIDNATLHAIQLIISANKYTWKNFRNDSKKLLIVGLTISAAEYPINKSLFLLQKYPSHRKFFNEHILPIGNFILEAGSCGLCICWLSYATDCL